MLHLSESYRTANDMIMIDAVFERLRTSSYWRSIVTINTKKNLRSFITVVLTHIFKLLSFFH